MKIKLATFIVFSLFVNFCYSQKVVISGEETSRKLMWADFTGEVDKASPYFAHTQWKLNYSFGNVQFKGDTATIGSLELRLELDPSKSWLKKGKATDELLIHEQGHFDCGLLCMNEFLVSYKKRYFTRSNYQVGLKELFNSLIKKYNDMGVKYDAETNHGMIREEQVKWNTFFAEQLMQYESEKAVKIDS